MAATRALRRFPFNLNLGTDICHVVRIRGILESSRGTRFIQKILNHEERRHPKIQRILEDQSSHAYGVMGEARHVASLDIAELAPNEIPHSLKGGPSSHELQAAATFMAGRYDHLSPGEHQFPMFASLQETSTEHGVVLLQICGQGSRN